MNANVSSRLLATASVLAIAGCSFLTWRMLRMSADSLYYLNLAAQFVLVIMGVLLALRDALVKNKEQLILTQVPKNFPGDPDWRK